MRSPREEMRSAREEVRPAVERAPPALFRGYHPSALEYVARQARLLLRGQGQGQG